METENLKNKIQSKQFQKIILCLIIGVVTLVIFELGLQVGYMKASFSYRHGDNYYRAFGPTDNHRPLGMMPNDISEAHGVSGKIVSVNLPTLVVADNDNTEKTVHLDEETLIREFRNTAVPADLKIGDYVLVLGEPNSAAEIDAKLIRVMPPPPEENSAVTPETPTPLKTQ